MRSDAVRLPGKSTVVRAAGAGIGRATALAFQRQGAEIWATDIDEVRLRSLRSEALHANFLEGERG